MGRNMEALNNGWSKMKMTKNKIAETYKRVNELFSDSSIDFMNHGYFDPSLSTNSQAALYYYLLDGVSVEGKDILDVGCGRGGGLASISAELLPKSATGLDLSDDNIAFCQSYHDDNIKFIVGDAEQMPFEKASFDIVVNVESAHCYPDYDAFLMEVHRVLRPGGVFVSADSVSLADKDNNVYYDNIVKLPMYDKYFEISEHDITDKVLLACLEDGSIKNDLEDPGFWLIRSIANKVSSAYDSGMARYLAFVCKRIEG